MWKMRPRKQNLQWNIKKVTHKSFEIELAHQNAAFKLFPLKQGFEEVKTKYILRILQI